jgi:hypothetical protein
MNEHRTIIPTSVRRSVTVRSPVDRAFDVFTSHIGTWWSATHHIGATPFRAIMLEPCRQPLVQDRQRRNRMQLGTRAGMGAAFPLLLAWQIDAQFHYGSDLATEAAPKAAMIARRTGAPQS